MLTKLKRYLIRRKLRNTVIVVSGLPRSGTSMMMKMLEAGGLEVLTDGIRKPDDDNPKGYYEFERVKKLPEGDTEWLKDARGKVVKVISALLLYLPSEYRYKVVFIRRKMPEIIASQRKMLIRRGKDPGKQDDQKMAEVFEKHLAEVEKWLALQANMDVLYVDYNAVLENPIPSIERVNSFVGGFLDEKRMHAEIDKGLYRNRT